MRLAAPSTLKMLGASYFNIGEVDICFYRVTILETLPVKQNTLKMIPALGETPCWSQIS